ncbi:MAG: hypothetical protein ACKVG9_05635 [Rhodospirillales bacterium]
MAYSPDKGICGDRLSGGIYDLDYFFLIQWGSTIISPTKVMSYTYLIPALVLILGLIFGNEFPPLATYPGIVLIVAATFVLQMSKGNSP